MKNDLLNILSSMQHADNQKLVDYLQGKLSGKEKQEVEQALGDSGFDDDALEGLQQVQDKEKIQAVVNQLNSKLIAHLKEKRNKRKKKTISVQQWIVISVIILLGLAVLAYFIISKLLAH